MLTPEDLVAIWEQAAEKVPPPSGLRHVPPEVLKALAAYHGRVCRRVAREIEARTWEAAADLVPLISRKDILGCAATCRTEAKKL